MADWQYRRIHYNELGKQVECWFDFEEDVFGIFVDTCGAGRLEFRLKPKEPDFVPGWYLLIDSPMIQWISWGNKERYDMSKWTQVTELPEAP